QLHADVVPRDGFGLSREVLDAFDGHHLAAGSQPLEHEDPGSAGRRESCRRETGGSRSDDHDIVSAHVRHPQRHSSTDTVRTSFDPMICQYPLVSPPTTMTLMSSSRNMWTGSSGAAARARLIGSSPKVARG